MKEKVVFFGAGPYVAKIIKTMNREFELPLVVTTAAENDPFVLYLKNKGINYISINKFDQLVLEKIKKIGAKIGVLASFGVIVPKEILDLFELGIINIHPSLLPRYRGPTPVQAAILAGDSVTGVSIIKLDEDVDHGPILSQIKEKIKSNDTSETLHRRLFQKGAELLLEVLTKYISGTIKPNEQNHSKATFTERLTRESGRIDLTKPPQQPQLDRMIRAYHPWPGVWFVTRIKNREVRTKLLPNKRIQVEGRNVMSFKDFANGYPEGDKILSRLHLASEVSDLDEANE